MSAIEIYPKKTPLPKGISGVVLTEKEIAMDTPNSDFWLQADRDKRNSLFRLTKIEESELWACARRSGKGKFITYHVAEEAFRNKVTYTEPDSQDDESLAEPLLTKIQKMANERNISEIHKQAVWLSLAIGRALVFKFPIRPRSRPYGEWKFRVTPIKDMEIEWDSDGIPKAFTPQVKLGLTRTRWRIPARNASLYINMPDPDGNTYEGISELEGVYYSLQWSSNILESWAELMNKRGLGLLDIKITGADEPTLRKYKNEWGDPSQYSVIFHDESWEVNAGAGVSPQYNLDTTIGVYTKETSSGSNISESRLNGVPMGALTGSKTDQDNFGTRVGAVQKHYHRNYMELHYLCDKGLKSKFGCKYDLTVKLDRSEATDIFSVAASAVNQSLDLLSYNQALSKLGMPPVKDGDMLASKWIAIHDDYNDIVKPGEGITLPQGATPPQPPENSSVPKADKSKQGPPYTNKDKRNETEVKKDRDSYTRAELRQLKIADAENLFAAVDSNGNTFGYSVVNTMLKKKWGEGLSYSTLQKIRYKD